ncbi:MAG: 50S ribosomal protein L21 [Candidatus Saccharimonadales bacterium]
MKKAVIATGGKQYIVSEGDTLEVELLKLDKKTITFEPLLIIDENKVSVGAPIVPGISVMAEVINEDKQADKVMSIRYKPKKRVHTVHGHRQHQTHIKITKIS